MQRSSIERIRSALESARMAVRNGALDGCDVSDIEDVIAPVEQELEAPLPNVQTLATYLNSLARSLRAQPGAREACKQLDAAMRGAGVPTHWEH